MLAIRKIIFFVLSGVYVIVCPLLVMYSLGYIYNPVKRRIVHTGMIRVVTIPPGADVFLERSRYKVRTPATISGVLVGHYRVRLKKEGYETWSQVMEVEPGKAAAFENVLLIPDEWPSERITENGYDELIPLRPGSKHRFLVAAGSKRDDCYAFVRNRRLLPAGAEDMAGIPPAVPEDGAGSSGIKSNAVAGVVLYWTRKDVWLLDSSVPVMEYEAGEQPGEKVYHHKAGKILQAMLVYRNSHILINASDTLYLVERQPQGSPHVSTVTRIRKGTDVFYDDAAGTVYYLESGNGSLRRLRIVPSSLLRPGKRN